MTKFIFCLNRIVARDEPLSVIAAHFGLEQKIKKITDEMVNGNVPFLESYIQLIFALKELPISKINELVGSIDLHEHIQSFIEAHEDSCVIVTENPSCWMVNLSRRLKCPIYCSECVIADDKVAKLEKVIHKEKVVAAFQNDGYKVVYIGDGNSDMEAMRQADISIACGVSRQPASSILSIADYLIYNEVTLCRQLNQLC